MASCPTTLITVCQGESLDVIARLKECDGEDLDLIKNPIDAASAKFPKEGGGVVFTTIASSGITIADECQGKLLIELTPAETQLLNPGPDQLWVLDVVFADAKVKKVKFDDALTVRVDPLVI